MNNAPINLLIKDTTPKPSETKALRYFRYASLGSFGLTLVASVVLLLLVIFHPLSRHLEQKNTLIQEISNSSEKYTNLVSLSDRLTNIQTVLKTRPTYDSLLAILQAQIPPGGSVQAIKMNDKDITFGVSSQSLDQIEAFISNVKNLNEKGTRLFRTLSLTTLTYNNQLNSYVLTLSMTLL